MYTSLSVIPLGHLTAATAFLNLFFFPLKNRTTKKSWFLFDKKFVRAIRDDSGSMKNPTVL
jgi:hypothetical protein